MPSLPRRQPALRQPSLSHLVPSYLHSARLLCHHERVTTDTPAASKPRRALIWWGAGLMILGVVLAIAGGAFFIGTAGSKVIATFTAPVRATPADFTIDLDAGTYVVYENTGVARGSEPMNTMRGGQVTITPSAIEVVSASGASVPVQTMGLTETVDRNNESFTGAARFTVVEPGLHRIKVLGNGQRIIVAPSIAGSFGSAIAWLGLVAIGGLVAVIGLVLLIVGFVRGRRPAGAAVAAGGVAAPVVDPWSAPGAVVAPAPPPVAPPVATPAAAPPGWFPDPKGEARLRWWDGGQWTDNVS